MTKAQSELAELISAARDFMIHVYAQAPAEALQGRTAESLFMELHDLSPQQAILQVKAVPAGAPSVRLAQAIKAATIANNNGQYEFGQLRDGCHEVIEAADPVIEAIKKMHPNDQGLDVMRLVNAISRLKALKGGA